MSGSPTPRSGAPAHVEGKLGKPLAVRLFIYLFAVHVGAAIPWLIVWLAGGPN